MRRNPVAQTQRLEFGRGQKPLQDLGPGEDQGIFAGGFMSVHTGEIPLEEVAKQLSSYLRDFERIVDLYRYWAELPMAQDTQHELLASLPRRPAKAIREEFARLDRPTVYASYNVGTNYATHQMRSYRTAFDLLMRINRSFQEHYPLPQG